MAKRKNKEVQQFDLASLDTYFKKRMHSIGITDTAQHCFKVEVEFPGSSYNQPIFAPTPNGDVQISYPCLYGGAEKIEGTDTDFCRIRFKPENIQEGGFKYFQPKESGKHVFFPPAIIKKFENKTKIETLYITEGEFKAYSGALHGLDIVGLGGKDSFTDGAKALHPDLLAVISTCDVTNLVLLLDADVDEVTWDPENDPYKDLAKRPKSFCNTVIKFREMTKGLYKVKDSYYTRIRGQHLADYKGLDDLLYAKVLEGNGQEQRVIDDLNKLTGARYWFETENISGLTIFKIQGLFHLNMPKGVPTDFFHNYGGIIGDREFTFNASRYQYNKNNYQVELVKHEESFKFIRIGCDYFKMINVPDSGGILQRRLEPWKAGEITRDYVNGGVKNFFNTIEKYDAACNVPCHTADYKPIIDGCFNMYYPLDHELQEGPWDTTREFLKHIFGEKVLSSGHTNYELALDYLTVMYRYPTQNLPIVALVNRKRGTGKSTFGWFLEAIYKNNFTEIGNEELKDHLNDDWASKLVVFIDEGFVEKKTTLERLKSMCTAHTIKLRGMYAGRKSIPFFAKFVISSNDEDNFAPIDDEENRFWVNKVPVITKDNPRMLEMLIEEVPYFLHYLKDREILHPNEGRLWFKEELTDTEAGRRVKENSKGWLYSDLKKKIEGLFIKYQYHTLYYSLEELMIVLNGATGEGKYRIEALSQCLKFKFNLTPTMKRHEFPNDPEGSGALSRTYKKAPGRRYEFRVEDFFTEDDLRGDMSEYFNYEEIIISRGDAKPVAASDENKIPF